MATSARPYAGVDAEERAAQRKAALLEAGLELLATVGTDKTTMTAVCATAGLTERYFYESFPGKADLFVAVLDRISEELRTAAAEAIAATEGDPAARVRAAVEAFVSILLTDPRKGRVALIESAVSPALRSQRYRTMSDLTEFIIEQARLLWGARALPPPHDRLSAIMYVGACTELIAARIRNDIDTSTEDIVDAATRLFVTSSTDMT